MAGIVRLYRGDNLIITRNRFQGAPPSSMMAVGCFTCRQYCLFSTRSLAGVGPGERILIDDGRIGGVIRDVNAGEIRVEITQARDCGEKLLADKGINLPDSDLDLDGLTAQDIIDLEFVARHADMVGLSFVRKPADIALLQQQLKRLDTKKLGIIIKIETRTAFEQLPELIFSLLGSPVAGVMIARGDLAVECGYERLAGACKRKFYGWPRPRTSRNLGYSGSGGVGQNRQAESRRSY